MAPSLIFNTNPIPFLQDKTDYLPPIAKDMNAWSYNSSRGAVPNYVMTRTALPFSILCKAALFCDVTFN